MQYYSSALCCIRFTLLTYVAQNKNFKRNPAEQFVTLCMTRWQCYSREYKNKCSSVLNSISNVACSQKLLNWIGCKWNKLGANVNILSAVGGPSIHAIRLSWEPWLRGWCRKNADGEIQDTAQGFGCDKSYSKKMQTWDDLELTQAQFLKPNKKT